MIFISRLCFVSCYATEQLTYTFPFYLFQRLFFPARDSQGKTTGCFVSFFTKKQGSVCCYADSLNSFCKSCYARGQPQLFCSVATLAEAVPASVFPFCFAEEKQLLQPIVDHIWSILKKFHSQNLGLSIEKF